jgi:hypothetical protein
VGHHPYGAQHPLKPVERIRTNHWALSIILSWVVAIHLYVQLANFICDSVESVT